MGLLSAVDPDVRPACELHVAGEFAQAAAPYVRVTEDHPSATKAQYLRAGAALRAHGIDGARHVFAHAAALEGRTLSENAEPGDYLTLGDCLRTAWRLDEALPCYEMALQLDDGAIAAYVGLGL